jgi:hypothetical protein
VTITALLHRSEPGGHPPGSAHGDWRGLFPCSEKAKRVSTVRRHEYYENLLQAELADIRARLRTETLSRPALQAQEEVCVGALRALVGQAAARGPQAAAQAVRALLQARIEEELRHLQLLSEVYWRLRAREPHTPSSTGEYRQTALPMFSEEGAAPDAGNGSPAGLPPAPEKAFSAVWRRQLHLYEPSDYNALWTGWPAAQVLSAIGEVLPHFGPGQLNQRIGIPRDEAEVRLARLRLLIRLGAEFESAAQERRRPARRGRPTPSSPAPRR